MRFLWFDHPLIEAWLERQLPAPRLTTSHADAASAPLDERIAARRRAAIARAARRVGTSPARRLVASS